MHSDEKYNRINTFSAVLYTGGQEMQRFSFDSAISRRNEHLTLQFANTFFCRYSYTFRRRFVETAILYVKTNKISFPNGNEP
jgi:hypothetical protein